MAMIQVSKFGGTAPRVAAHLLPEGLAVLAQNCDLRQGPLIPMNEPEATVSGVGGATVYQYGAKDVTPVWLSWSGDVDVVRAPVSNSNHRIYWTGDGYPKAREFDSATEYRLGVIRPTAIPTITTQGTPPKEWNTTSTSSNDVSTGTKTFTIGINSATNKIPSGALVKISVTAALDSYVSGTVTSHSGATLVVNITSKSGSQTGIRAWTVYAKDVEFDEDSEIVRTTGYIYTVVNHWEEESAPYMPDDLPVFNVYKYNTGVVLTGLCNPTGNSFKEFRIYRISVGSSSAGFQYVGATTSGSFTDTKEDKDLGEVCPTLTFEPPPSDLHSLIALSNGVLAGARANEVWFSEPYIPYAWPTAYKVALDSNIVGLGFFGSTIVACTQTRPYIISGINPASPQVQQLPYDQPCLSKRSIVSTGMAVIYAGTDGLFAISDSYSGKNLTQAILTKKQWLALTPALFRAVYSDNQYLAVRYGQGTGVVYDFERGDVSTFSLGLSGQAALGVFYSLINDCVYIKTTEKIQKWNAGTGSTASWTSKEYVFQKPVSMACYRVRGGQGGRFSLYVDGVLAHTSYIVSGTITRLPAGRVGHKIQFQIDTTETVYDVAVATSVTEIRDAD